LQHAARERQECTRALALLLAHSPSVGPDIPETIQRSREEVRDLGAHVRHQTLTLLDSLLERSASADTSTQAQIEALVGAQLLRDLALRQD
jgi:predicted GNAT superfamily acetyltransferase